MRILVASLVAVGLGAVGWTLLEYLLHRFVFHGASATRLGAKEHRQHHAQVDYFAAWWKKALGALAATAAVLPLAVVASGATITAFGEPLRVWARSAAAGQTLPVDFNLGSASLRQPVSGTLRVHIR